GPLIGRYPVGDVVVVTEGSRLQRSSQRVVDRAQHFRVIYAETSADHRLVVTERAVGEAETGQESVRRSAQALRQVCLTGRQHRSTRRAIFRGPASASQHGAGIESLQEARRQQARLAIGIDHSAGFGDIWVEVADVARSIRVSGMKFPAQPVFQGQIVTHPETVLRIGVVVIRAAVVILLNIVQVAISWDAQKEVAKRRARELAAEPEGAVVIGALKSQRTHGANVTVIEAEF